MIKDLITTKEQLKIKMDDLKEIVANSNFKDIQEGSFESNIEDPYEVFCSDIMFEFYKIHRNLFCFKNETCRNIRINFEIYLHYYWEYVDNKIKFDYFYNSIMSNEFKNNIENNNLFSHWDFFKIGIEYDKVYTFTDKKCYESFINLTNEYKCFAIVDENEVPYKLVKDISFEEYKFYFMNEYCLGYKLINDKEKHFVKIKLVNTFYSEDIMLEDVYFKIEQNFYNKYIVSSNSSYEA